MAFLAKAAYIPEKRQAVLEFSSGQKKFSKRYGFFPFFFLPNNQSYLGALKKWGLKKIKLEALDEKKVRVIGATFYDLIQAAKIIETSFGKQVLLLPPQKQFLIEKNWGYFDSFEIRGGEVIKSEKMFAPEVFFELFSSSIEKAFFDLKNSDESAASEFLQKICLSNILKTEIANLPAFSAELGDVFLENIFFKYGYPILFEKDFSPKKTGNDGLNPVGSGVAKISFLKSLNSILAFPFHNVGFDSINCECCKNYGDSQNVSPSSLVWARFLVDGLYFESSFMGWAKKFHESEQFKKQRVEFQKEWGFDSVPAGPFFSNQKHSIPLADYWFLSKNNFVEKSFEFSEKVWFCKKKESFLSKELKEIDRLHFAVGALSSTVEFEKTSSGTFLLSQHAKDSFSSHYFKSYKLQLDKVSESLLLCLMAQNPCWLLDERVSGAVDCIKAGLLKNFKKFAEESSFCGTKLKNLSAFISSKNPLFLAKNFSRKFNLREPEISF